MKEDGIEALYKGGVLIVSIPKAESFVQKRIEIKSEWESSHTDKLITYSPSGGIRPPLFFTFIIPT